ncbi:MAG TPA: TolC family protein, partial [Candidimonas sp.]|nr:TolC family protein [Candidimonas sp.]
MNRLSLSTIAAALLLAGCTSMAPDYQQPAMPTPGAWPSDVPYDASKSPGVAPADMAWQQFIVDENLRKMVELALEHNRDLRVAALNIDRARAQYQIQRADSFPSLGINAAGNNQRLPADLAPSGETAISRQYSAGVGMSAYELDLFG